MLVVPLNICYISNSPVNRMGRLGGFKLNLCTMVIFTFGVLLGMLLSRVYFVHMEPVFISTATVNLDFTNDTYGHSNESLIADELFRKVRVVCMILTMPANHETKAIVVQNTWASRCNVHFFLSSVENKSLNSLVQEESRDALWDKTKFGIRHAVEKYSDYDFFLKADDDTFVIVENLRKLLRDLNPNDPFIMGRRFRPHVKQGYLSGGGGYVISRAALLRIHNGLANDTRCAGQAHGGAEDVRLGHCAEVVGVRIMDSLDEHGLERFHPFSPGSMMSKSLLEATHWFMSYNYHKVQTGIECCSDYAVTFHYVAPSDMYVYYYFLYHLHPYGIHRDFHDVLQLCKRVLIKGTT
ncbi:glycoprotein-N-acetylgalactosamine 3-beta-galactosyltransferase [Clonorchis sinensis]|uniref:N-acetylgalactosaminide beta-1,3-galactosyltransferase n=1 Tax=Clonorchis sinensis TaxID=79923 RepID=G7YNU4_CLOSI|nr:glycoprotein-N-acetylgalactosamine 3-beta-galactosyltransferase [Clonorchis sinensis]